ncbi:MAG: hypothetical protein M0C28_05320 [Candidatus Moduliflexus flocculans]|nr:hypothetical protein [Candidatus Moduliflexus flocculans]
MTLIHRRDEIPRREDLPGAARGQRQGPRPFRHRRLRRRGRRPGRSP